MKDLQTGLSTEDAAFNKPAGAHDIAEQRLAEERLRESEVRYRTLFNTIDEGFCIIEFFDGPHGPLSDYVHVEANPAYERHAGIPNVVGQKVRDLVPEEADGWVELYRSVLLTGQPIRFERTLVATGRYLELSAFRVEPESRRQVAVLFQDVTARKRVEEALRENRERLQAALDGSGTGTFRWNIQTNALDWDENLDRLFGLTPGKTIRSLEKFVAVVHPEDQAGVIERCRRCAEQGVDFSMEFRVIWPDGGIHWLDDQGKTFHDEKGQAIYMTGMCRDITQRKQDEQALRQSEERFRTVADSAPVLIWQTDSAGVMFVNRHYLEFFGVEFEAVAGMGWADFLHPQDYTAYVDAYRSAWDRQAAYEFQCRFRRSDGEYRWLHNAGSPQRRPDGSFLGFVGSSTDVTEQMAAHELMQSEAKRLEVLVQQRTATLQAALGELEAFSYSVAHDLRAPLRAMSGYARALENEGTLSTTGRTYVQRIDRAATRMDRLTQEVLAYSQLSRTEVQLQPVNLEKLVNALIEEYPNLAAHQGHIVIRSPLLPVIGHEPLLTQALANLLGNACKFVNEGSEPNVLVRTEELDQEVRIWVEDSGIGIAPEHRSRLFKLFGRIHPEKKFAGTGVGLAIVSKAAERMGGSVGFDSEAGSGSRFWLQLKKP
ncbi:MAG TPA: PAS domain S-box protein [Candidatus Kapabacteria bacterium]|nr:PAS domain S-box protein [Candidatus Kapabacteria bacterium]